MKSLRSFKIVEFLKDKKHCSMNELMQHFKVSQATIHRDIAELVKQNHLRKIHGGVALPDSLVSFNNEDSLNSHFSARINKNSHAKTAIAESAAGIINDGDIIFLDSSTTALYLARKIQQMNFANLTIITNSVLIIQDFHLFPSHFFLISIGGNFNCQLNSFLGKTALENLCRLKIDKVFFSGVGLKDKVITTFHEDHAGFLKKVLELADQRYLLVDSSKFGKAGLFNICNMSETTQIISDKPIP